MILMTILDEIQRDREYLTQGSIIVSEGGLIVNHPTRTIKSSFLKKYEKIRLQGKCTDFLEECIGEKVTLVFRELEKVLSNEKILKAVLERVNEETERNRKRAEKELQRLKKERQVCESRKNKLYEAYEEGILNGDEFLKRKQELTEEAGKLQERTAQKQVFLTQDIERQCHMSL